MIELAPQHMINVEVSRKPPLETCEPLCRALREAEEELAGCGRVLIRYSGTQPLCRVMVEGPTRETTERLTESLAGMVRQCLGEG